MLKSCLPGINTSIFPKRHYDNILYEKLVYELHVWIENHPYVIQSTNLSDSLFVNINGSPVNKYNHLLQISIQDLYNDIILTICQGEFFGARTVDGEYVLGIHLLVITCQNISNL